MAINFIQNIPTDKFVCAYDNNVVKWTLTGTGLFKSVLETPIGDFELTGIVEGGTEIYYFNFLEVFKVIVNQETNFSDSGFVYDDQISADTKLYKNITITYKQIDSLGTEIDSQTFTYHVIKGVNQLDERIHTEDFYRTSKHNGQTIMDMWEGYPFSFAFSTFGGYDGSVQFNRDIFFFNRVVFTTGNIARISLIGEDGEYTNTLPVFNQTFLAGQTTNVVFTPSTESAKINVHPYCEGFYLKWFNKEGAYDYWLFSKKAQANIKDKSLGEVNTNYNNLNLLEGVSNELGKVESKTVKLTASFLDEFQFNRLIGIAKSPVVYYWVNDKFIRVKVNVSISFIESNKRGSVEVEMMLPERMTQKI